MKVIDIIKYVEKTYPVYSELDFDNSGANIVDESESVTGILVCLDATLNAIKYARDNNLNMIVSHHPIIFNAIKNINDDILSTKIKCIIKNSINCYSVHTNFDMNIEKGMCKILVNKIFDKKIIKSNKPLFTNIIKGKEYGGGSIILLNKTFDIIDIVNILKSKLAIKDEKISYYYNDYTKKINKIVIMPGSGSGDVEDVIKLKPDLFITSDLKHNQIIDLLDRDISYINATHYGLEKIFVDYMSDYLQKKFKIKILKYYSENL